MTQYTSRAQLKEKARDQMAGHYGNAILLSISRSLIVFSLTFAVSMTFTMILTVRTIMGGSAETSLTEYLLLTTTVRLYCRSFAGVFQTGITLFYLNTACNRPAVTANLFYGFKYLFKKSLGISAVLILLNTACTLPFDICYFLLRSGKGFDAITMAILCIVLMVIGMCIYIPLSLGLSQAYYLLLDFPQYNAMELMKLSFRIMKGHKWELFCLQMSFLPLGFLCLLSFGIGSSMAGAIYEHDPDLIFSGSDAERAQALIACALYCLCYHRDGVQYHIFLRIIRIISGIHINFSIFQLIDLNLVRSNIVT